MEDIKKQISELETSRLNQEILNQLLCKIQRINSLNISEQLNIIADLTMKTKGRELL